MRPPNIRRSVDLTPAPRTPQLDAAAVLGLLVMLLSLVPARLILPGMTDLGRPGLIVGFLVFCWWLLSRLSPELTVTGPQPLRWAFLIYLVTLLVSYAAGFARITTAMESNSADRAMLFFCIFAGVALTAADGVRSWDRMRRLLQILVACAAAVSAMALVQYLFRIDVTRYLTIPGLHATTENLGFEARGSAVRVAATATHYIELATFLALALPFAIHFTYHGRRPGARKMALLCCVLIVGGIAATVSRTGILGAALVLIVLWPVWSWRRRYNVVATSVMLFGALAVASPSLERTLVQMFSQASADTSVAARQARYPMVFHYFWQHPWLGRGTGTWVPPQYQVLDNQWLETMLSNGVVGVAALAGLHLTGIVLAWRALRRSTTDEDRHLCAALLSTQVVALVAAGTFDSMAFLTYATTLALALGLCGAAWRLSHRAR